MGRLEASAVVFHRHLAGHSSWLCCPVCFDSKHATGGMSRGKKWQQTHIQAVVGLCDDASQHQTKTLWWAFFCVCLCFQLSRCTGCVSKLLTCCSNWLETAGGRTRVYQTVQPQWDDMLRPVAPGRAVMLNHKGLVRLVHFLNECSLSQQRRVPVNENWMSEGPLAVTKSFLDTSLPTNHASSAASGGGSAQILYWSNSSNITL